MKQTILILIVALLLVSCTQYPGKAWIPSTIPTPPTYSPTMPKAPTTPTAPSIPTAPTMPTPPSYSPQMPKAPAAPTAPSAPTAPVGVPSIESPLAINCNDGVDNDLDGLIDCKDPTYCATAPNCLESNQNNNCANTFDDDFDGKIDCADSGCAGPPACQTELYNYNPAFNSNPSSTCYDGIDNDLDSLKDCKDLDCFNACEEVVFKCYNNFDDNQDGLTDLADPTCLFIGNENNGMGCIDGFDNNRDGLTDCLDPLCANNPLCFEGSSVGMKNSCNDGIDNDNDGFTDCQDTDCNFPGGVCGPTETGHCSDNLDNDLDGSGDCSDSDCTNDFLCSCSESDNQIDPRTFGFVTFGGVSQLYRSDECLFTPFLAQYTTVITPTSGTPTWLRETYCPASIGPVYNIHNPAIGSIIDCKTVPGVVKGICQNGRCV